MYLNYLNDDNNYTWYYWNQVLNVNALTYLVWYVSLKQTFRWIWSSEIFCKFWSQFFGYGICVNLHRNYNNNVDCFFWGWTLFFYSSLSFDKLCYKINNKFHKLHVLLICKRLCGFETFILQITGFARVNPLRWLQCSDKHDYSSRLLNLRVCCFQREREKKRRVKI
jgi:hypothetical protein